MLETSTIHWPYQTHISKLPKLPYSFSSSNVPHSHSHSLNCNLSSHFKLCRSRYCTYLLFLSLQPSSLYLTLSLSLLCSNSLSFTFYISHTNTHLLLYVAHTPSLSLYVAHTPSLTLSLMGVSRSLLFLSLQPILCSNSLSRTHPYALSLSLSSLLLFSLSPNSQSFTFHFVYLTHEHTLSLSLPLSLTHTHSFALYFTLCCSYDISLSLCLVGVSWIPLVSQSRLKSQAISVLRFQTLVIVSFQSHLGGSPVVNVIKLFYRRKLR